ncbi:MAG TPA: tetraacyldisaccharide 4'-kinase [Terracidiphilus sp.]|jgi:tetraacyldisaccharide 4'-kinase
MRKSTGLRKLLLPLVPAYRLALWLREVRLGTRLEPVRRLHFPVVSIGNLSTGGAGKTPLAIALAKALAQRGFQVDVLSRGYGRRGQLPVRVAPDGTAEEFGDEPLLIAREAGVPVYVAGQRYDAGLLAEAGAQRTAGEDRRPRIHLLDDGFQHRQLARDVDILLMNRQDWQDGLLPAGNLREPLRAARRATVIAIPASDEDPDSAPELEAALRTWGFEGPVWRLQRRMEVPAIDGPVVALCGIARPEQFFAGLEAAGLHLAARIAFPDHHRYAADDLDRLVSSARASGATALITTEKDLVRLGKLSAAFPESLPLLTACLRIEIEHEREGIGWLVGRLKPVPAHRPL